MEGSRESGLAGLGYLAVDDTTLDKPYRPHIELVTRIGPVGTGLVVEGINLITLLWTDGDLSIPVDFTPAALAVGR